MSDASDATTDQTPAPDPTAAEASPASPAPAPSPVIRYEWGPDVPTPYQPPKLPGVKDDANVVFDHHDTASGDTHFALAPHDPTAENVPAAAHVVLYASGQAIHSAAADAIAAAQAGDIPSASVAVAVTDPTQPTPVVLPRPATAKANTVYTAKTVLEFHDPAPDPAPVAPEPAPAS